MDFLGAIIIESFYYILQLSTAYDGIFAEEHLLAGNKFLYGNKFHAGNKISNGLFLWHETSRPGRRVFDKRSLVRNLSLVGIADCMSCSGLGHSTRGTGRRSVEPAGEASPFGAGSLIAVACTLSSKRRPECLGVRAPLRSAPDR